MNRAIIKEEVKMSTKPYYSKALAIVSDNHGFSDGELIEFLGMDSEVNVNSENELYYLFKSVESGLVLTLEVFEFNWVE
jgi:hypothetical protein